MQYYGFNPFNDKLHLDYSLDRVKVETLIIYPDPWE
jgi:hypothetical protein